MCSGVKVGDEVFTSCEDMKLRRMGEDRCNKKKVAMFCINNDDTTIVEDFDHEILVKDVDMENAHCQFARLFPRDDCRYALYDVCYQVAEGCTTLTKEDLVLISWIPDCASIKKRMLYASSKNALLRKLTGISCQWNVSDLAELENPEELAEKLCPGKVVCLEGKSLMCQSVKR